MCEIKSEVIEKRKDSWLYRFTFHEENDLRKSHQDMIAEIVKAGREQHEKLFGVETNDEAKKYTQAEMDQAIKKLKREGESMVKKGDVVKLKSGGPLMTVVSDSDDRLIKCMWFDNNLLNEAVFHFKTLDDANPVLGRAK